MSMQRSTLQQFRPAMLGAVLSISVFTLIACRQEPDASAAPPAAAPAPVATPAEQPAAADAPPAFLSSLSEGMAYASLRSAVIDAGWRPLRDPSCWNNVGGGARVCDTLPEVESCSGDGACLMYFADPKDGRRLRVTTYGPYERWNVPGEESSLAVRSWDLQSIVQPDPRPSCPGKNFDEFLKRFSEDESIERAFTAPLVQVARVYEDEQGYNSRTDYESGSTYRGYILDYKEGGWYLEPIGSEPPVGTDVSVTQADDGSYFVTIPGNVEGISYRFESVGDCWQLTADPEDTP